MASSKYVNIFKEFGLSQYKRCCKEGNVSSFMDRKMKSTVYRITGAVPANNYLLFPDPCTESMSLTGRYLYILFQPIPGHYFVIHCEIVSSNGTTLRLSLSNLFKEIKMTSSWVQIPFTFSNSEHGVLVNNEMTTPSPENVPWTFLVIDLKSVIPQYFSCNYGYLKTLKICANVVIKGAYISDVLYNPQTQTNEPENESIPHDLCFPLPKGLLFNSLYQYLILPDKTSRDYPATEVKGHCESTSVNRRVIKIQSKKIQKTEPNPIMKLVRVIGMGGVSRQVIFSSLGSRMFYICHSIVVAMETRSEEQQLYIGHTDQISCIAVSGDDLKLASSQSDLIRIWEVSSTHCLRVLKTSHQILTNLCMSYTGVILCGIGRHQSGKILISIWETEHGQLLIKSVTEVGIDCMRIANFDDSRMISCGWNNIRFWRIKEGRLKSSPVNLEDQRCTRFTDIQFESGPYSDQDINNRHVYACTNTGYIFEVHYRSFAVKRVWQLFPDTSGGVAITSLALHESYCVTGSDDGFLRLWPLDFSYVAMETDHGSPLLSVGVAKDGLNILVATAGYIGILDISSQTYHSLLRTHTDTILRMSLRGHLLMTCSNDGSLRLWDRQTYKQLYEFTTDGELPMTVSCHPISHHIVVGYDSGIIRCIGLDDGQLLNEHKHHTGHIMGVVFTPNGHRMFSSSINGLLAMYDSTHQAYPVLKILGNTVAKNSRDLVISDDGCKLAFIGPLDFTISVVSTESLDEMMRYDITPSDKGEKALSICFTCDVIGHMIVLTNQNRLLKYSTVTGQLLAEVRPLHNSGCSAVAVSNNGRYIITGGVSGEIKIWDYSMRHDTMCQAFIGHSDTVSQILISENQVITSADGIFIWNITLDHMLTPPTSHNVNLSISPRKKAPSPISYKPLNTDITMTPLVKPNLPESSDDSHDEIIISHVNQEKEGLIQTTPINQQIESLNPISKSLKYYRYIPPTQTKPNQLYLAPPSQAALKLNHVIGFTDKGRGNILWHPPTGLLIYSSGSIVVLQDLSSYDNHTLLVGHPTEITTLALQHDGCGLVSASYAHQEWNCEIRVWDIDRGCCIKVLSYHKYGVICMSYSLDDRFLLSVGDSGELVLWCTRDYTVLIAVSCPVLEVRWDPKTAYEFATVGVAGLTFWIFEENTNELKMYEPIMPSLIKNQECTALCYAGHFLYIGTIKGIVAIWNTQNNKCLLFWKTDCSEIGSIVSNNKQLVVGGANGTLQLWSIDPTKTAPSALLEKSVDLMGGVYSMVFDTNLQMGVVSANTVWYINWLDESYIDLLHNHHGNITGLQYCSKGDVLASCDDQGIITIWDTIHWNVISQYITKKACTAVSLTDHTHQLICICGYDDGYMRAYNVDSGNVIMKIKSHDGPVTKLTTSVDGQLVLSGSTDGIIIATDLFKGLTTTVISDHKGSIITDIDVTKYSVTLPGVVTANEEVWLVASHDQRVSIWCKDNLIDWLTFPVPPDHQLDSVALAKFSSSDPDHILYTGHGLEKCLQIYSLTQKTIIKKIPLNYWATCIAVSHDGHMIALGSQDQVLTLMDSEGVFQESSTHCHMLSCVAFSPNGSQFVSSSQNNFHIWQVQ